MGSRHEPVQQERKDENWRDRRFGYETDFENAKKAAWAQVQGLYDKESSEEEE